ncbi:SPOR domain-containing protein [Azovibrio restrictus]|uniref:SPOR domain-containing protein n=1 Tax=Azovibrio restrictus TaxID=146938 RepID=UPI0026EDE434|nr:SPOR domain-containing protein [Azovibrio restrictus]MDD3481364.1 SPOR domain-containing protein [Azovibrio restrictus]
MIDADDVQLQIKKKARRRLVGAVAFAALAALVLPMVMDQEPKPPAQEVEIHIPGQDGKPFQPSLAAVPVPQEVPAPQPAPVVAPPAVVPPPVPVPVTAPQASPQPAPPARPVAQVIETVPARAEPPKPAAKPEPKPSVKPEAKPAVKPESKPAAKPEPAKPGKAESDEAKRAAAILAGNIPAAAEPAGKGPHVVLIGAFANEANVQNIKTKLGELGIKVYTEPLDSPQGKKTRVRAGPFPSREAADKALEKMKRIGVSGVVAAK